jgi:hypothetical protein
MKYSLEKSQNDTNVGYFDARKNDGKPIFPEGEQNPELPECRKSAASHLKDAHWTLAQFLSFLA